MHVEAMNWSGMGVRAYVAAMQAVAAFVANGVTDWNSGEVASAGARIFTPPPARTLALVLGTQLPKGA